MGRPCQCCDDPLPPQACPIYNDSLYGYYDSNEFGGTRPFDNVDFNVNWNAENLNTPGPIVDVKNFPNFTIVTNNTSLGTNNGTKLNVSGTVNGSTSSLGSIIENTSIRIIIKFVDVNNYMFLDIQNYGRYYSGTDNCDYVKYQVGVKNGGQETLGELAYAKDGFIYPIELCYDNQTLSANITINTLLGQNLNPTANVTLELDTEDNDGTKVGILSSDWSLSPSGLGSGYFDYINFTFSEHGAIVANCPLCEKNTEYCWSASGVGYDEIWGYGAPVFNQATNKYDVSSNGLTCIDHPYHRTEICPNGLTVRFTDIVNDGTYRIVTNSNGVGNGVFAQLRTDNIGGGISEVYVEIGKDNVVLSSLKSVSNQLNPNLVNPWDVTLNLCLDEFGILSGEITSITAPQIIFFEKICTFVADVETENFQAGYEITSSCSILNFNWYGTKISSEVDFASCPSCVVTDCNSECEIYQSSLEPTLIIDGADTDWETIPANQGVSVNSLSDGTIVVNKNTNEGQGARFEFTDYLGPVSLDTSQDFSRVRWCVEFLDEDNYLYAEKTYRKTAQASLYQIGQRVQGEDIPLQTVACQSQPIQDSARFADLCYTGSNLVFNSRRQVDADPESVVAFTLNSQTGSPGGGKTAIRRTDNWGGHTSDNKTWIYTKNGHQAFGCPTCFGQGDDDTTDFPSDGGSGGDSCCGPFVTFRLKGDTEYVVGLAPFGDGCRDYEDTLFLQANCSEKQPPFPGTDFEGACQWAYIRFEIAVSALANADPIPFGTVLVQLIGLDGCTASGANVVDFFDGANNFVINSPDWQKLYWLSSPDLPQAPWIPTTGGPGYCDIFKKDSTGYYIEVKCYKDE